MKSKVISVLLLTMLTIMLNLVPACAQHENDLHFGVTDCKMLVKAPATYEVPKIMYYNGSYWIRDQGIDGVLVSDSYYELKSVTWKEVSYTQGLIYGGWFGKDWLGNAAKVGYVNLDDGDNRHIHKTVAAGVAGTYLLTTYLCNGVDHLGNSVLDSNQWTMIWVTNDPNNPNGPAYAQVDLPLLRNLPDTPSNATSLGFAGVDINGLVVSGIFSTGFYAQTEQRTGGVYVITSQAVSLGDRIRVKGNLSTNGSERIITTTEDITATSGSPPKPLGVTAGHIGGSSTGKYTPGTTGGVGLSTTGLLIRIAGVVRNLDSNTYVSDGSTLPSGLPGVRVSQDLLSTSLTFPSDGKPIAITGISGTEVVGDDILPVIRPREQSDITAY